MLNSQINPAKSLLVSRANWANEKAKDLLKEGYRFLVYRPEPEMFPDHHVFEASKVYDRFTENTQIIISSPEGLEMLSNHNIRTEDKIESYDLEVERWEEYMKAHADQALSNN